MSTIALLDPMFSLSTSLVYLSCLNMIPSVDIFFLSIISMVSNIYAGKNKK